MFQNRAYNLFTGDPGVGKSTVICDIAAAVSTGRALPGETEAQKRPPMNVWLLNGEDAADDTTVWRLENQGADLKRILLTDQATLLDASSTREMNAIVRAEQIKLIVIDPIQAW